MKFLSKLVAAVGATAMVPLAAHAFSLSGPTAPWMTADLGYLLTGDIGGPVSIGEQYRVNQPVLVYGFDQTFVDFFGQPGIDAVEQAIKILNDLPPASEINPAEYPLATTRVNHTARRLRLLDLKTTILGELVGQLGLASPERYTWTLRKVNRPNDVVRNFLTIKRNYDPFTLLPSSFVNETLYTYRIQLIGDDEWEAGEISLDPNEPNISIAGLSDGGGLTDARASRIQGSRGLFAGGLTRDDVGGIRFLYHPGTVAVETLPVGSTPKSITPVEVISSGGGGNGWTPSYGVGFAGGTNVAVGSLVNQAVRRGVDKIRFVRGDVGNPILSSFKRPVVVRYTDSFSTNGVAGNFRSQSVERRLLTPDIIFQAGDLGTTDPGTAFPVAIRRTVGQNYVNLGQINTMNNTTTGSEVAPLGPGIIDPGTASIVISLARVGLQELNSNATDNLTEEEGWTAYVWGSYDGSTNAPIVYPIGRANLRMVESIIRNGRN
ncbi:MAG: hypothetical protein WCR07_09065 [Verrucomicrobiota bacterium]|jgi:hypothetical protein